MRRGLETRNKGTREDTVHLWEALSPRSASDPK